MEVFKVQDEFSDVENRYSFPTTCYGYIVIGNASHKYLEIWGTGAPAANYNNAPLDSIYHDVTNHTVYVKDAATSWGALDITT